MFGRVYLNPVIRPTFLLSDGKNMENMNFKEDLKLWRKVLDGMYDVFRSF
jgi:hypothetical protein